MKQKLLATILATALVLVITACGDDSSNSKNDSPSAVEPAEFPNKEVEQPDFGASYTVEEKVRKVDDKEWQEVVNAEIGDQVEFQIEYKNTSTETQSNVMISDVLPGNLKYIPGTTKLYNMNHPNWASIDEDDIVTRRGINIGSYEGSADGTQGGNAFIRFTAEVVDADLAYGENFIYNWGQATVGDSLLESSSVVIVQKPEQ